MTATLEGTPAVEMDEATVIAMNARELGVLLKNALTCSSTENYRPLLASVRLEVTAQHVRTVSTDSYRMLIQDVECVTSGPDATFILEARDAKLWVKSLMVPAVKSAEATIAATTGQLRLSIPGTSLTAVPVEGTFPNYETLIPVARELDSLAAFNGVYLATMGDIVAPTWSRKDVVVPWKVDAMDATKPALFTSESGGWSAQFVLMPVRV